MRMESSMQSHVNQLLPHGAIVSHGWSSSPLVSPVTSELYVAPYEMQHNMAQRSIKNLEFQRLRGKRKLSLDDLEIIEVKVDDHVDTKGLLKRMTEETAYKPCRKENLPPVKQRRKNQIQYLAFQAKERELELKNMWAQDKMNKNHLRSRYGF